VGVELTRLSPGEVAQSTLRTLGLGDAGVELLSPEGLAASLRRAASFLCPSAPGRIVQAVLESLGGLPGVTEETRLDLEAMLETLIGFGDLLELPGDSNAGRRVFLGPPAFVRRASGTLLLLGVRPEAASLVGDDLSERIEYKGHARLVRPSGLVGVEELLAASELLEFSAEQWSLAPRPDPAGDVVEQHIKRLQAAGPSGDLEGLRLIDPSAPVTYYRGRWRPPKKGDRGHYIARRPQVFGADLWCFASLIDGICVKLIDLPLGASLAPAADEAWRTQAALDAIAGHPQRVHVQGKGATDPVLIDFYSPLPSWSQRRLDVVGTAMPRSRGALFSYSVPKEELGEELRFLREMLWMSSNEPAQGSSDGD
jgi:hypothetical protein